MTKDYFASTLNSGAKLGILPEEIERVLRLFRRLRRWVSPRDLRECL
jgi:hypothetical protein